MSRGALTVVGTGIQVVAQTSLEATTCIERADKVYFVSADALTEYWIRQVNVSAESLNGLYEPGKNRMTTYEQIIERVVGAVDSGLNVCFVGYGHPGVFAHATHESIRRVRRTGCEAQMLPGISADACLFADLGIDPGVSGCQSFEATDFLVYHRRFDPHCALLLWQIGVIGEFGHRDDSKIWNRAGLGVLAGVLIEDYSDDHTVTVYEAARYPCCSPSVLNVRLADLSEAPISSIATLYVPPIGRAEPDLTMLERLVASSATRTSSNTR
jgi:uncharacterized protein YabN with tetrapyrrole methylase and pyrophosphatase domain